MAMIKCRECKQEISDEADKCPHCGAPKNKGISVTGYVFIFLGIGLILMILAGVGLIGAGASRTSQEKTYKVTVKTLY